MTNPNVPITITSGVTLTVNGDIHNSGTSTINNNGTITLTGHFTNNTNNNLFGTSAGTVILNGTTQNLFGNSVTAFNNLVLSGSGFGTKNLFTNILTGGVYANPAGVLALNDRTLTLNSNQLIINNSSTGAITRTTGFIESETTPVAGYSNIKWDIGNNTGIYTFPFGTSSGPSYIPLEFNIISAGSGSQGNFTVSTYPTNSTNTPLPNGVPSVINSNGQNNADFVLDRFWIIEPADYISLPVSNLTFTYRDIEHTQPTNTISESLLQMQFYNGTVWSPTPAGTVNTTANTILVNNVSNYAFAWTAVDNSSPLPIELLHFTAVAINKKEVLCKWATATEINNDYFIVQRSADGLHFEDVGIVNGAGNSNSVLNYNLKDNKPYEGVSYYRLKQVDFDGKFSYSNVVAVNLVQNEFSAVNIYPNPTRNKIFIHSSDEIGKCEIMDIAGRIIFNLYVNNNFVDINLEFASPGIYFINIKYKKFKIVKQ